MFFRFTFTLVLTLLFQFTHAQLLWQVTGDRIIPWKYAGGDEFSGSSIDTSKWMDSYPWGRNLYCSQDDHYYTAFKNCEQGNGSLKLIAKKEKITARAVPYESDNFKLICDGKDYGTNLRNFEYTSGMIFSKKKYHYGYFEIRFRSAQGSGLWPAFWLYAGHENDEIDIFEMNGSRNHDMHVDVHCQKGCKNYKTTLGLLRKNWGDYLSTSANWNSGFNTISAEWQPEYIKWFLNGKPVAYWKGSFQHPMWVIANLALSRDGGPFGPGPDAKTTFPSTFEIDYIRIWNRSDVNKKNIQFISLEPSKTGNAILEKGRKPESKRKIIREFSTFLLFNKTAQGSYTVEISGDVPESFSIEVSAKGKLSYSSTDPKLRQHTFTSEGNGHLKIQVNGKLIEQSF